MRDVATVSAASEIGGVEQYALARVTHRTKSNTTCSDLFADYRLWCAREALAPLREASFTLTFLQIARESGIGIQQRGSNLSFLDVAIGDVSEGSGGSKIS